MADAVRTPEPEPVVREVRQGPVRAARRQIRERTVEDVDAHAHVERPHGVEPVPRDKEGVSRPQNKTQRRRAARVRRMLPRLLRLGQKRVDLAALRAVVVARVRVEVAS